MARGRGPKVTAEGTTRIALSTSGILAMCKTLWYVNLFQPIANLRRERKTCSEVDRNWMQFLRYYFLLRKQTSGENGFTS